MKVGKTSLAAKFPRNLILCFENGVNALPGVMAVPMGNWSNFKKIMKQLRDPRAREKYDTITFDTVAQAWADCERYVCSQNGVENIRDIPWGGGFQQVRREFSEALRELTMLGFGLVLITHSKDKTTEAVDVNGEAIVSKNPDLPDQCLKLVNALVDVIGYISVSFNEEGQASRNLITRQTPRVFAGSRYKYLKPVIPLGYTELVNAIADAIDEQVKRDGAEVSDEMTQAIAPTRSFDEVIGEAKVLWTKLIGQNPNNIEAMNQIIVSVFGHEMKLSQANESQVELLEDVLSEFKKLLA